MAPPAAARQANARVRPRAVVSGPAHRPHPAQPSVPAPAGDPTLDCLAGPRLLSTYNPPSTFGDRHLVLQFPPSAPWTQQQKQPGIFTNINLITFLARLSVACPTASCKVLHDLASLPASMLSLLPLSWSGPSSSLLLPQDYALWFPLGLCLAGPFPHSGVGSTATSPRRPT